MILVHPSRTMLSLPNHREVAPFLLRALLKESGITVAEFKKLL